MRSFDTLINLTFFALSLSLTISAPHSALCGLYASEVSMTEIGLLDAPPEVASIMERMNDNTQFDDDIFSRQARAISLGRLAVAMEQNGAHSDHMQAQTQLPVFSSATTPAITPTQMSYDDTKQTAGITTLESGISARRKQFESRFASLSKSSNSMPPVNPANTNQPVGQQSVIPASAITTTSTSPQNTSNTIDRAALTWKGYDTHDNSNAHAAPETPPTDVRSTNNPTIPATIAGNAPTTMHTSIPAPSISHPPVSPAPSISHPPVSPAPSINPSNNHQNVPSPTPPTVTTPLAPENLNQSQLQTPLHTPLPSPTPSQMPPIQPVIPSTITSPPAVLTKTPATIAPQPSPHPAANSSTDTNNATRSTAHSEGLAKGVIAESTHAQNPRVTLPGALPRASIDIDSGKNKDITIMTEEQATIDPTRQPPAKIDIEEGKDKSHAMHNLLGDARPVPVSSSSSKNDVIPVTKSMHRNTNQQEKLIATDTESKRKKNASESVILPNDHITYDTKNIANQLNKGKDGKGATEPIISTDEFTKMESMLSSKSHSDTVKARNATLDYESVDKSFRDAMSVSNDNLWKHDLKVQKHNKPRILTYHDVNKFFPDNSVKGFVNSEDYKLYLFYAIAQGDTGTVDTLLNMLGDVNIKTSSGETPLLYATRTGNTKMVRYLIVKGANIDATNNNGLNALAIANNMKRADIVEALNEAIK